MALASGLDFTEYLRFCCSDSLRQNWQSFYTPISAELRLQAQTVSSNQSLPQSNPAQEEKKRMDVLTGLRQFAPEHVLLVGKPGSGKSMALKQLLWEDAQQYLEISIQAKREKLAIPVLIELRDCREGVALDWLHRALRRANLTKKVIEILLSRRQFLLLFDGLNELPSSEIRAELDRFRRDYADVPMIFTTRELGGGEDLGIKEKLEMVRLSEVQMRHFIEARLPGRADALHKQLQGRLQELAETPLLLWMLCEVFAEEQQIPKNRGELFRRHFTQKYDQFKQSRSLPISEDSRRLTAILLQHLAFEMMQGNTPTEFRLQITISEARQILEAFLRVHGEVSPASRAGEYLEDLLEFHILQLASDPNKIEFHHQLFQEYYAAEFLLPQLSRLNDEQIKCHYLNYLKWTESVALVLALLEDKTQALRVVKLALQVDLKLGARLTGEIKPGFQEQAIDIIRNFQAPLNIVGSLGFKCSIHVSDLLWVELLEATRTPTAIPELIKLLRHSSPIIRMQAVAALEELGSDGAVPALLEAIEDSDTNVRQNAMKALKQSRSEQSVTILLQAINHPNPLVRYSVCDALKAIGSSRAIPALSQLIEDSELEVRRMAISALGSIDSEQTVPALLNALEDPDWRMRGSATDALSKIGSDKAISGLLRAIEHPNPDVRKSSFFALNEIGTEQVAQSLLLLFEHPNPDICINAIVALGRINSEWLSEKCSSINLSTQNLSKAVEEGNFSKLVTSFFKRSRTEHKLSESSQTTFAKIIQALLKSIDHSNSDVREHAIAVFGKIVSAKAIPTLIEKAKDPLMRRSAAFGLGETGSQDAIPALLRFLKDPDFNVRMNAAHGLGRIGSEQAIPALLKAAKDSDINVRWRAVEALTQISSEQVTLVLSEAVEDPNTNFQKFVIETLGRIGSEQAIPALLKAAKDLDVDVRKKAIFWLGEIGSERGIHALLEAAQDADPVIRKWAASSLGEIKSERAVPELLKALENSNSDVRRNIVIALGKIGSESAIPTLLKILKDLVSNLETFRDPVSNVRKWTVWALGEIGSQQVVPVLVKATKDIDCYVRASAVEALGEIGSEETTSVLIKVFQKDRDQFVRERTAKALGEIGSSLSLKVLWQEKTSVRQGALPNWNISNAISMIQNRWQYYNHEIYLNRGKVENGIRRIEDEEVRQLIYHIETVGNLNTGTVIIQGNQTETK